MYFTPKLIALLCLKTIIFVNGASNVVLTNNGYEGVVVALDKDVPVAQCQDVLLGLENTIRSSSKVLFKATRGRASFSGITVLVPSAWNAVTCPLLLGQLQYASSGENYDTADLKITKGRHPNYGARPWTLQTQGCAMKGDYISMGKEELIHNDTENTGRLLANAWLKYRYGVFDEVGESGSKIHPPTYRERDGGVWTPTACTNSPFVNQPLCHPRDLSCPMRIPENLNSGISGSFMAFPEVKSVTELCDEGTHNPNAPTPQNLICGSKSVWEVLRASPDFQNNQNVEGLSRPKEVIFKFVQSKKPRLVLLVEDTNIMNVQNRWDFMRKAVRKLVTHDIPESVSAGLVVFDSNATINYNIKPLTDHQSKYNLGSALPRNPSKIDRHRRCVACGIEQSMKLLHESGGTSGGHIILMMAGSSKVDERELEKIERMLSATNVVLHIIVYPLTEKYPETGGGMELISSRSGGLTFTIPNEGIGADSKIVMYYNLIDALYNTLKEVAGEIGLPVKVHSAEHQGGLLQDSEGSFWVDPGLGSDTTFSVFFYHLGHVGDAIHLISPIGQIIDTGNIQREEENMNMITIQLKKNQEAHGLWRYKLENGADSHQALFVQVTSRPQNLPDSTKIKVRTWTSHEEGQVNLTDIAKPLTIFSEVRAGLAPVSEAKVTAVLIKLGVTKNGTSYDPIRIKLHDNGLLSPDIKQGDGVYSRYVTGLDLGKYSVVVYIEGHIGEYKFTRQLRLGHLDIIGFPPKSDMIPPSRITDLRASLLPDTDNQVSFAWTAPGGDYDIGQARRYKVMISTHKRDLKDHKGDEVTGWPQPLSSLSIQQHAMPWKNFDTLYYIALYAVDDSGNTAPMSNIVEVFVPLPTTPAPSIMVTSPSFSKDVEVISASGSRLFTGITTRNLALVFGCLGGVLLMVLLVVCYCTSMHRKGRNGKTNKCPENRDDFNVTVTVGGGKGNNFTDEKQSNGSDGLKKDYLRPINSWSPSELLGHQEKRGSLSGRSDNNSDQSDSSKKSYGGLSEPPQYYSNGVHYSYENNSYNDAYPIPSDGYPTPVDGYPQSSSYTAPIEGYHIDGYPVPAEIRSYVSSQPSDSFMSESIDVIPGTQGPPGYSLYPQYDPSMRNAKIPPPIPPKPKVMYTPEPYVYEGQDQMSGSNSSNASVSSEKRIRNVTMV